MLKNDVVFFDGVCNLCSHSVQWVIQHDKRKHFRFASLQSELAKKVLEHSCPKQGELKSIIVRQKEGAIYMESKAIFYILKKSNGLYKVLGDLFFPLADNVLFNFVYRLVSRNRYSWFGKRESCWIPTPDLKSLFLD